MSRKKAVIISAKPSIRNQVATATPAPAPKNPPTREKTAPPLQRVFGETTNGDGKSRGEPISLGLAGKIVYGAVYGVSYGVVFTALVLGTLVPGRNIIAQAMTDATQSAKQTFGSRGKRVEKHEEDLFSTIF